VSPLPIDLGDGAMLRSYTMEDLNVLWEAVERDHERIAKWMPWAIGVTRDAERTFLERVIAQDGNFEGTGLFIDGRFAGGVGLTVGPFGTSAEIGYWITSEFEGRGYVTRACRALIDMAFGELGVHRVVIRAGTDNVRSRAIPERLGFTEEGVHREEGSGSEGFHDLVVYGLLDREWPR
jgi:ribosomal-protein-serine acetyltransferase